MQCFCLFLFCFCLVRGEQVTDAQDFGWQSKGNDHFRSWSPFFSCLLGDNSVLFRCCLVQRPFYIFLLFPSDPWSGIFFLLLSFDFFDWEFFPFSLFFFVFSQTLIGNFLFLFSPTLLIGSLYSVIKLTWMFWNYL